MDLAVLAVEDLAVLAAKVVVLAVVDPAVKVVVLAVEDPAVKVVVLAVKAVDPVDLAAVRG